MTRRLLLLLALSTSALIAAAIVFDLAEGRSMWSLAWWAVVTAITVGYGDFLATTTAGGVAATLLMHSTTLLVLPLITVGFAARLIVDNDAFTHDDQEEIKLVLRRFAIKLDRLADEPSAAAAVVGQQPLRGR